MKLRKVEWWEVPRGKSKVTVLPVHTKELRSEPAPLPEIPDVEELLKPIKEDVDKLKKRRPEFIGGVGATGSYHEVTSNVAKFQPSSFNPGINVIGVRSGEATTIWLPSKLEPNHLISVKDELGVASTSPITIRVYQN